MTPLHKLHAKLCRELAQTEHSAIVHTRRDVLEQRVPLLEAAEREVTWFAQRPRKAIRSGATVAVEH